MGKSLFDFGRGRPPEKPQDDRQGFYKLPPAASVGWYWTPRVTGKDDYSLDLDAGERYTRPKTGFDFWGPKPIVQLKADQHYAPQAWMVPTYGTTFGVTREFGYAKTPSGPLPDQLDQEMTAWNYSHSVTAVQMILAPKGT